MRFDSAELRKRCGLQPTIAGHTAEPAPSAVKISQVHTREQDAFGGTNIVDNPFAMACILTPRLIEFGKDAVNQYDKQFVRTYTGEKAKP